MKFCKPSIKAGPIYCRLNGLILKMCDGAPLNRFIMKAKKRSRSKGGQGAAPAAWRFSIVLSTAARSLVDMTLTAVTSGSVLLCLFAVKRFL